MVLIQEIRTVWSKASRGGAAAARRSSVPEAALFHPPGARPAAGQIFHRVLFYGEANDFAGPIKSEAAELTADSTSVGCVRVEVSARGLTVAYEYDYGCGGLPPRMARPGVGLREEMTVGPESWARVRYNGRFSGEDWWYQKVVVNVGSFERPGADVFIATAPAFEISQMAKLR